MPRRKLPPFPPGAVLVGGAARDLLRGETPKDYDWAVPDPRSAAQFLAGETGAAFPLDTERDYWRVVIGDVQHDLVPLPADLNDDLLRRDFTVNALALDEAGRVTDPTGGQADLKRRQLRMVSEQNLQGDPLRLLRAARLSTSLGFVIEPRTGESIRRLAKAELPLPAAERVGDELDALLRTPDAARGVLLLHELGLLALYLPELTEGDGLIQGGLHHLDVLHHNIEALHQLLTRFQGADLALRWATLLHDVGKPRSQGINPDTGRQTFYGHAERGAELTRQILERLKRSRAMNDRAAALVGAHMVQLPAGEREARRFVHRRRALLPDLIGLMLADREAARGKSSSERGRLAYGQAFERVLAALEDQPKGPAPLLGGHEIMTLLSLTPGPRVGELTRALAEAQALGDVQTQGEARAFVQQQANV
ncbi:HDIG domain-containing metalloprotein [Deinococcus sp.]|uniref:HDIG domain-containing metalloprotein n=1 Tax=Deinococcus sp. TaxID=47478 RepID=UPI0025E623AA|nr:HDIG domain-containing metalloprotein [Deinococcus sp.]